jgi:hypothetical protein
MISKRFFEPVYRVHVVFIADCTFNEFRKKLSRYGLESPGDEHIDTDGMHAIFQGPDFNGLPSKRIHVVWVRDACDFACLVHEVTHLTISVFDGKGMTIQDNEITEAVAYYLEHWIEKFWPLMNKKHKKGGRK